MTLLNSSLFPNGPKALDDEVPDVRADVIEELLDPSADEGLRWRTPSNAAREPA